MSAGCFRITGHVQGVGFRYFTRRVAQHLGVRGWVRNCVDGDVEVHAEASPEVLLEFEKRLQLGPPFSKVLAIQATDAKSYSCLDFSIKR